MGFCSVVTGVLLRGAASSNARLFTSDVRRVETKNRIVLPVKFSFLFPAQPSFPRSTARRLPPAAVIVGYLSRMQENPRAEDFPEGADFDEWGIPSADIDVITTGRLENFLVAVLSHAQVDSTTQFLDWFKTPMRMPGSRWV